MKKILSLDGGGTWALIQVRALMEIYGDVSGTDVLRNFDLVVANSGGSIVAGALAGGAKLSEIINLFLDPGQRGQIFVPLPFYDEILRVVGLGPKYSAKAKLDGLRAVFNGFPNSVGDIPLRSLPAHIGVNVKFVIVGFDFDSLRSRFFRSDSASRAGTFSPPGLDATLAQAAHASSNAPINYFDEPAMFNGGQYWDGAVAGFNNPVLAGVLELLAGGAQRNEIAALSIGTANVALPPASSHPAIDQKIVQGSRPAGWPRIKTDLPIMAGSIIDDPPDAASFEAHMMLTQALPADAGHPISNGTLVRLNPLVRPVLNAKNQWVPPILNAAGTGDDLSDLETLINLGMDATEASDVALIQKLATAWIKGDVRNQPIRYRGAEDVTTGCEIGHYKFSDAVTRWKLL